MLLVDKHCLAITVKLLTNGLATNRFWWCAYSLKGAVANILLQNNILKIFYPSSSTIYVKEFSSKGTTLWGRRFERLPLCSSLIDRCPAINGKIRERSFTNGASFPSNLLSKGLSAISEHRFCDCDCKSRWRFELVTFRYSRVNATV